MKDFTLSWNPQK